MNTQEAYQTTFKLVTNYRAEQIHGTDSVLHVNQIVSEKMRRTGIIRGFGTRVDAKGGPSTVALVMFDNGSVDSVFLSELETDYIIHPIIATCLHPHYLPVKETVWRHGKGGW